jgi:hypothetical protein
MVSRPPCREIPKLTVLEVVGSAARKVEALQVGL